MAPHRASVSRAAGMLLALSCGGAVALAMPEGEGASSAAPTSCAVEQFALRSYVIALRSGDVTSGAHDPARIAQAITPLCRQAIENGRWPGLAHELLPRVSQHSAIKRAICEIGPPEALAAIVDWETADEETRAAYDLPCAVALFRHRPDEFARVVAPRLGGRGGCAFPDLATRLGEAIGLDERIKLLPTLDFATRTRSQGRDRLYGVLCQHPAARAQAACQAPPALERTWAHEARIKRAAPAVVFHVGVAALFALAACLLCYHRGKTWPAVTMSALATAATAAAVAWIMASAETPGAGALNGSNFVLGLVVAPVAALIGGLLAWVVVRNARGAALAWCLLHAAVYGLVTAVHVWRGAWDRLC